MGDVLVAFRVMPKDVNVNIDSLVEKIRAAIKPDRVQPKPIAFGIVAIEVIKFIPDAEGELEKVEKKLKTIENVGEVEITEITRTI
jgi:translation elongation factor aEF-1 beta